MAYGLGTPDFDHDRAVKLKIRSQRGEPLTTEERLLVDKLDTWLKNGVKSGQAAGILGS